MPRRKLREAAMTGTATTAVSADVLVEGVVVESTPVDPDAPQHFPDDQDLRLVPCPLYPGLAVEYSLDQALYIMATPMPETREIRQDPLRFFRWLTIFVRRFEGWRLTEKDGTPIPAPDPANLPTFLPLLRDQRLLLWVAGEGFYEAIGTAALPNSTRAS